MMEKLKYLIRSALNFNSGVACPNCGSSQATQVDRKYFFTRLFECDSCKLQFRHPVDSKKFSQAFYQQNYVQKDGITTDLPSKAELESLIQSGFDKSTKNVARIVALFSSLKHDLSKLKVIDYGCSWGYMTYQFRQYGISAMGFEVSRTRADFGNRQLGLNITTDSASLPLENDIVFSSHVIEHVPSIPEMISDAKRLLTRDGLFIAESPNGSESFRINSFNAFHQGWGLVHPNYLSDEFYRTAFGKNPFFITSTPYDLQTINKWDGLSQTVNKTDGPQLLVISKPNQLV